MDEVDIDNVEDLNELESRLYAQIHHEITDEPNKQNDMFMECNDQVIGKSIPNVINPEESFKTTSETNRIVSKRYWISGDQHYHRRFIRNPFKTQNISQEQQHLNRIGTKSKSNCSRNDQTKEAHNSRKVQTDMCIEKTFAISTPDTEPKDVTSCIENTRGEIDNQKLRGDVSNLKINPIAEWMQRKENHPNKKVTGNRNNVNAKNFKNSSINIKQGLFARQQEKLRKAKRIEERRQKSKKTKIFEAEIINKVKSTDIIDLDSDNDSDNSDVIVIPTVSPPIFTVDDSGDEVEKNRSAITMEHEENALDSADVQMSSTTTSFIKPQNLSSQASSIPDSGEKRIEISSRCTSPCSIHSSDDFIGQTDRNRLLTGASGIADDEDLLVLTSDINSLLEVPENSKPVCEESGLNSNLKQQHEENFEVSDTFKLAAPITTNQELLSRDYRVDHGQYRALDVYESESDKMDSVYSKGANKSTVIRQIDTSSDDVEDIGNCSHRTKRLRKRRASSSNKESDPNNGNFVSSSDNEGYDEDDNNVLRTMVPFIAKGVAVEYYKPRKGNRTLFSNPIADKRISAKTNDATDPMSDTKFIETLNNLVQCQDGKKQNQTRTQGKDEDEESEIENIPTARDIAAKVLAEHSARNKPKKSISDDVAIPTNILEELEKVFETIDQLDKKKIDCEKLDDGTVQISDSSDSDREKHFIYKSVPGEKAQVIDYNPKAWANKNSPARTHDENGSPIYNILYIRGPRDPGGIGWNKEMRKFYNESWNGEHFTLGKIFQKMNPDKSLWRIYTEDRFSLKLNKRSNMKCTNCCELGHIRSKCKRPRKPLICYMCGDSGHLEPRCPNTLCLRCGNKTQVFTKSCNACSYQNRLTCPICKIRGHSLDFCPDKWRRYHSTTEGNTYPNNNVYYNPRKYCCICGARGHISDNCRSAVRFSEYPSVTSSIKSHHKSYNDVIMKAPYNGIAINLMYKPFQEHTFNLLNYTTSAKYYGRFLKAVGMNYLLKRKLGNDSDATVEMDVSAPKKNKSLSEKYEANPYLKAAAVNKEKSKLTDNAPNQVQEITESGSTDQQVQDNSVINIVENGDKEVEVINSSAEENDLQLNIQLNTLNESPNTKNFCNKNFKSPKNVTSTSSATTDAIKLQTDSATIFDSDSNYSFSEHFDIASRSEKVYVLTKNLTSVETLKDQTRSDDVLVTPISRPREMEALPDFIPLVVSTDEENVQHYENESAVNGISRRFVVAASDDDEVEENNSKNLNLLTELPCEAKIYLTQFHTKFLLSPNGNAFLKKISQLHKLKTRLDFTSVGHVLIISGLPTNQNKFQMELLLKYRELEDERNQRQLHSSLNVPKRTYVLIKFLRDSIIQLMNNLGNVNHLLKRLQFLEKQQTKTGYKLAEKVRRSLNMILVGQAGLQDGTMHLDKLLIILKKLLNDVNDDVAPAELRSEISDHYKVIFSAYRHDNYQKLVDIYNKLISKNRMPLLKIDPILLGQKVLDTSLSEQQKQKIEQPKTSAVKSVTDDNRELIRETVPSTSNHKNTKVLKRKQNTYATTTSPNKTKITLKRTVTSTNAAQTVTSSARDDNNKTYFKTKSILSNRFTKAAANTNNSNTAVVNKTKQTTSATNATALTNKSPVINNNLKKQTQMIMPPPTYVNPEKRSTTNNTIQEVTDKWQRTCDNLLTQITSEKSVSNNVGDQKCSSKLPSNFWSGESMRYLENCVRLASTKPQILEKLQRVQKKSQNGQLSYNDYLAVIKLHNALNGK